MLSRHHDEVIEVLFLLQNLSIKVKLDLIPSDSCRCDKWSPTNMPRLIVSVASQTRVILIAISNIPTYADRLGSADAKRNICENRLEEIILPG